MKVLFVHQNFPAQFRFLAPALASAGHQVFVLTRKRADPLDFPGGRVFFYEVDRGSTLEIHPWLIDFETQLIRAQGCFRTAQTLKAEGFVPDVIFAHPGWGESLFLNDVWPAARLLLYCEFFYRADGQELGFDPEFPVSGQEEIPRLRMKNLCGSLHFELAVAGLSPTHWQASAFPDPFRSRISIVHDGIDTDLLAPNPGVSLRLGGRLVLDRSVPVVTFVARNLEPYRGYHAFMRAVPEILDRHPTAHILIVGGDGVSYGPPPDPRRYGNTSWRDIFLAEVKESSPTSGWDRVHFLGQIPYAQFVAVLQISAVHVYLTYPFVLSWSLLEAMSVGCAIVASDTAPVREAIEDEKTGILLDFFSRCELVDAVGALLSDPARRAAFGKNAREAARTRYDLRRVCLPAQLAWLESNFKA